MVATPTDPRIGLGGAGRPPMRGTLRTLSPATVVALTVPTIAVGWFLPLFGLSLLAFLIVDVAVAATKHPHKKSTTERSTN